ncbi:hypothetical protein Hte_007210 [Hypoxylon texense]
MEPVFVGRANSAKSNKQQRWRFHGLWELLLGGLAKAVARLHLRRERVSRVVPWATLISLTTNKKLVERERLVWKLVPGSETMAETTGAARAAKSGLLGVVLYADESGEDSSWLFIVLRSSIQ